MKIKASLAFICFAAIFASALFREQIARAQNAAPSATSTHAPGQPALPTTAEVDAALRRTLGYDASVSWQIVAIRPASSPGLIDVSVSINKQPPMHLYLTADGKHAIAGEMIPFGADPFAPARTLLLSADGPARGADKPSIQVVEFSDLECPHCKAAQPVLDKLVEDFPDVRFVFQQFPLSATLHPWAMKAAEYTDCAGRLTPEAFWKFADNIFAAQADITVENADDKLKEIATASNADAQKIAACAASPDTESRVKKSMALGASLDVDQTPTVFINGRRVPGIATIPYDQLKNLVKFEVDHAGK